MKFVENDFLRARDLSFVGILHDVKKSKQALQPVYEAFTNAIEAIKFNPDKKIDNNGSLQIELRFINNLLGNPEFESISISDNGIGFNEEEFTRFNTFKDTSKGFHNLGSGRIQFVHYFDNTTIVSRFLDGGKCFEREFSLSKSKEYLKNNSIVFHKHCKEIESSNTGTIIKFSSLLENSTIYHNLTDTELKNELLKHYIHFFCSNRDNLPQIKIFYYVDNVVVSESTIDEIDIPIIHKSEIIDLPYYTLSSQGLVLNKTGRTETFSIDAFRMNHHVLLANELRLVSKGEVVEEQPNILLKCISETELVEGYKYLFLISSKYIDDRDTNVRGELNIPSRESLIKNYNLFSTEEIISDDIQDAVNDKIISMYPEIKKVKEDNENQLIKLKQMFLLDDDTSNSIKISMNDSESKILEKFYEAEAKKIARLDASIKCSIDKLEELNPSSETYYTDLQKEIDELVKIIPLQNRNSLTHYVARRKLVLEVFNKIIRRQLNVQQKSSRNDDEKLLHNLIFQQSSTNPLASDLWLINEDFIYFDGTSNMPLKDIEINGELFLRNALSEAEDEYRRSLKEDRFIKRPDVLLFPDEGKCIIIEFKNPTVNVSEHLMQITNYANLIWNFSNNKFSFKTFYGYLIGEGINETDVRSHDGDFKIAYHLDYLFRPHKVIPGFFEKDKEDASLYTEVIKYSTLLQRALRRNEIFIQKLVGTKNTD